MWKYREAATAVGWATCAALLALGAGCSKDDESGCGPCDAPSYCLADLCQSPGAEVVRGGLGVEPGQFGVVAGAEAESEGPRSLAVSPDGRLVYLLDQVNQRVEVFDGGALTATLPLESASAFDVAALDGGRVVVMDRDADRFSVLDETGRVLSTAPVSGPGVQGPGFVDGLFVRDDGVWLRAAPLFVHVLDARGEPVERRRMLTGLVSPDGESLLSVELLADGSLQLVLRPARGVASYRQRQLRFERRVAYVVGYDLDAEGRVYVATEHLWDEGGEIRSEPRLSVLSPELEDSRSEVLPPDRSGRGVTRALAVGRPGGAYYLHVDDERVAVLRY